MVKKVMKESENKRKGGKKHNNKISLSRKG